MKGLREIKSRIRAVKSTGQITHAMQLVAASKMKKAQSRAEQGRAYTLLLLDMLDTIEKAGAAPEEFKLFQPSLAKNRLVIVFSTDKGLCGPLNTNLFKHIAELPKEGCSFVAVGEKAARFIARDGRNLVAKFKISDFVSFSEVRKICEFAISEVLERGFDTIEVLYPAFINTLRQEPVLVKLAPVSDLRKHIEHLAGQYKVNINTGLKEDREFIFEPSPKELLMELPLFYLKNELYHMALDAKASEQSARMVAMKNASDNADTLMQNLTLEFNKARQSAITTEIIELSGAAQALENS